MPKLIDLNDSSEPAIKPLSRQASVQSNKSINSAITLTDVSDVQSSLAEMTTPADGSMSRTPSVKSIKRDSIVSRSSAGGGISDHEPIIEHTELTELLSDL